MIFSNVKDPGSSGTLAAERTALTVARQPNFRVIAVTLQLSDRDRTNISKFQIFSR